jgi:hypothetical protein
MTKEQLTEKIKELSGYRESAQKIVDNYRDQIQELEFQRTKLLDAVHPNPHPGVAIPCRY